MNTLDYVFGKAASKDLHSELLKNGYIKRERVPELYKLVKSDDFRSLCRLLIVVSDRQGRHEERKEDSYARFPVELELFLGKLYDKVSKKKD